MKFFTILLILSAILTFKVNGDENFSIQFDNWDLKSILVEPQRQQIQK